MQPEYAMLLFIIGLIGFICVAVSWVDPEQRSE